MTGQNQAVVRIGVSDRQILVCLSETGGWTAGQIARQLGYSNVRSEAQRIGHHLRQLEGRGLVGRLDDRAPVAWVRTSAGTGAINV